MIRSAPAFGPVLVAPMVVLLLLAAPGCGGTQVSNENRDLLVTLATATSTRETQWLEKSASLLEERRAAGQCTDAEYAAFQEIISKGKAGEWDAARDAAYALRDAQEPTAEDLKRVAERKLDHHPRPPEPKGRGAKKS